MPSTTPATTTTASPISQTNPLTGHCFCGAIHLEITSPPLSSYICHCTNCRRATGSCFAHNANFPDDASSLHLAGSTIQNSESSTTSKIEDIDSVVTTMGNEQSGRAMFCSKCGTTMLLYVGQGNEGMRGKVIVPVGVIDGSESDERLRPVSEGWCKRREGWMGRVEGARESEEW